jgi:hypothetical protein
MAKIVNITHRIESCKECPYFRSKSVPFIKRMQCALTETDLKRPFLIPDTCPLEDA